MMEQQFTPVRPTIRRPSLLLDRPDSALVGSEWSLDESVAQELENLNRNMMAILLSEPDEAERRMVELLIENNNNPDDSSSAPQPLGDRQHSSHHSEPPVDTPENVDNTTTTSSIAAAEEEEGDMNHQDIPTIVSVDLSTASSDEDSVHGFRRAARERLRVTAPPPLVEPLDVPQNDELGTIIRFHTDNFGFEEERQRLISVDLSSDSTSQVYTEEDGTAQQSDETRAIFAEIDEHNAGLDEWLRPDPVVDTLRQQATDAGTHVGDDTPRSSQMPVGTFRPEQVADLFAGVDELNADLGDWRESPVANESTANESDQKKHRMTAPLKSNTATF